MRSFRSCPAVRRPGRSVYNSGSVSAWWIFAVLALSERFRFRRHIRQRSGRLWRRMERRKTKISQKKSIKTWYPSQKEKSRQKKMPTWNFRFSRPAIFVFPNLKMKKIGAIARVCVCEAQISNLGIKPISASVLPSSRLRFGNKIIPAGRCHCRCIRSLSFRDRSPCKHNQGDRPMPIPAPPL